MNAPTIEELQENIKNLEKRLTHYEEADEWFLTYSRDITDKKKVEDELLRLSAAIEQSSNSVVITDLKGDIIYVNKAFTDVTEYTSKEAIGQNPRILKTDLHEKAYYKSLWDTILNGDTWNGEFQNRKKDGSIYWEKATITPVRNSDGKIVNYIAIKEDVTELKKKEEEIRELQEYLQLQIDRMPIALIVWDNDFHVKSWNPSAQRIFGFSEKEALGKLPHELILTSDFISSAEKIWQQLLEVDDTAHSTNENIKKDGKKIICEWLNTSFVFQLGNGQYTDWD